jgi:hypothetical protein
MASTSSFADVNWKIPCEASALTQEFTPTLIKTAAVKVSKGQPDSWLAEEVFRSLGVLPGLDKLTEDELFKLRSAALGWTSTNLQQLDIENKDGFKSHSFLCSDKELIGYAVTLGFERSQNGKILTSSDLHIEEAHQSLTKKYNSVSSTRAPEVAINPTTYSYWKPTVGTLVVSMVREAAPLAAGLTSRLMQIFYTNRRFADEQLLPKIRKLMLNQTSEEKAQISKEHDLIK